MDTIIDREVTTAPSVTDTQAAPLSAAEGDALLALSASSAKKTKGSPVAFHVAGSPD